MKFKLTSFFIILFFSKLALAQDYSDSFDPFADYTEFEEASEEEADINFFKNGRFFSLGLILGYRTLTGSLNQAYTAAPNLGISLTYFFDMRFALQISYSTSTHPFSFTNGSVQTSGTTALSGVSFDLKYFFSTQNVTKGLANLNPYVSAGYTQNYFTQTISRDVGGASTLTGITKDSAASFNFALGIEMPIMKGKMYIGAEAQYQFITWPGEGGSVTVGSAGTFIPNGDLIRLAAVIGANF